MIRNDKEYRETLARLEEDRAFAEQQCAALTELGLEREEIERAMQPVLSFQAQLEEEVAWYERVRRGDVEPITRLTDIGRLLIALRISKGLSQAELAKRLGVAEQQVSRDERNEYHGIALDRAQRILDALEESLPDRVQNGVALAG
jgi:DNA-directed RNA polymerase specialized sigma subunit